ncbi:MULTISPECIES: hypothetical protein [Aeromonas]|uniref:hypothetical protein n=1 Tax=Aeromonas TaxID=642 RepID=UPI00051BD9C0|nr:MULTISPECIES: hypothetical protein [Aeromonas]PTT47006.1 hypothetical protein DBR09_08800 [Aeromonas sp. HMWF016]
MGNCVGKNKSANISPEAKIILTKMAISNILAKPIYRNASLSRKLKSELGELSTDAMVGQGMVAFERLYQDIYEASEKNKPIDYIESLVRRYKREH